MCNPEEEALITRQKMGSTPIDIYFRQDIFQKLPPNQVAPGHCLRCGIALSFKEMHPVNRAPRYMCQSCYEKLAYNSGKDLCLWCGNLLPDNQRIEWQNNPRELMKYAFCPGTGLCLEYQKVLAGIVFGINFNTVPALPEPDYSMQVPQFFPASNSGNFLPAHSQNQNSFQEQPSGRAVKKLRFLD